MRRAVSLSLDLDNKWSYLKTHGDPGWQSLPSYLDVAIPRILEFLRARGLIISFFVVGQDAAEPRNAPLLRAIAQAGHEIANHSFSHEPWLHLYSEQQLDAELARAEEAIFAATGVRTTGFRGPGYSLSPTLLAVLVRRGYAYDASVFPNLLNPLARAYFFASSRLSAEEKRQRRALFGTWKDALRPAKPFHWGVGNARLLEIPVTTMPVFKLPMHLSYLVYLAGFSRPLAWLYRKTALAMCTLTGTTPSLLLHPLDFLGREDCTDLDFFPGMNLPRDRKLAIVDECLADFTRGREPLTLHAYARLAAGLRLPTLMAEERLA